MLVLARCLRYCKSTIFQANHNQKRGCRIYLLVVCDTAKVRFFKQITTTLSQLLEYFSLFAILQKYDFSSKSQQQSYFFTCIFVVCDTAKVRFFKQITTSIWRSWCGQVCCLRYCKSTIFQANHNLNARAEKQSMLFAILQKYDFSSKSQLNFFKLRCVQGCLRYCKSTIFQANHNRWPNGHTKRQVVCDTAKVRFFKQITT